MCFEIFFHQNHRKSFLEKHLTVFIHNPLSNNPLTKVGCGHVAEKYPSAQCEDRWGLTTTTLSRGTDDKTLNRQLIVLLLPNNILNKIPDTFFFSWLQVLDMFQSMGICVCDFTLMFLTEEQVRRIPHRVTVWTEFSVR